jgi:hypothetical protein
MRAMQRPYRFLTTSHQRQRLVLWALAMLSWIAAVLFAGKAVTRRQLRRRCKRISIHHLTRLTLKLMIVRAAELAGYRPRKLRFWKHGRDLRRPHLFRTLIGSKLRRTLKHKDPAQRIAILTGALRNLDLLARRLAQRMKRRLTRLWPTVPAPAPALALVSLSDAAPALADTS